MPPAPSRGTRPPSFTMHANQRTVQWTRCGHVWKRKGTRRKRKRRRERTPKKDTVPRLHVADLITEGMAPVSSSSSPDVSTCGESADPQGHACTPCILWPQFLGVHGLQTRNGFGSFQLDGSHSTTNANRASMFFICYLFFAISF